MLLGTVSLRADEAVPDYAAGFQKLIALGLPDSKGATYVHLEGGYMGGGSVGLERYTDGKLQLTGNAWLLKDAGEGRGTCIVNNCRVVDVITPADWQQHWQELAKSGSSRRSLQMAMMTGGATPALQDTWVGTWSPADLKADATNLIAYLSQPGDEPAERRSLLRAGLGPTVFLFAALVHRNGMEQEGNRIAHVVLTRAADRQKVVEGAIGQLADVQYTQVYGRFSRTRDWGAFSEELAQLLSRFPKGWAKGAAVERLKGEVAKRLASPAPVPTGEGLTDDDRALAAELCSATNLPMSAQMSMYGGNMHMWLLPSPGRKRPEDAPAPDVMERLTARGLASVPLLIALLDDTYLTQIDNQAGWGAMMDPFASSGFLSDMAGMPAHMQARMQSEMAKRAWRSLMRPLTRGEVATALLAQVVPLPDSVRYSGEMDPAILKSTAATWYEENKAKTPNELARALLGGEDVGMQQHAALRYLARHGSPDDLAFVEAYLLNGDPMRLSSPAIQYVQLRGDQGRGFAEAYVARLETSMKAPDKTETGRLFRATGTNNKKYAEQLIKQFKDLLTVDAAADLLKAVVEGREKLVTVHGRLQRALSKEEPEAALTEILTAATQARDTATTLSLLEMASMVPYLKRQASMEAGDMEWMDEDAQRPPDMPDIARHAKLWRTLLSDTRSVDARGYGRTRTTIADTAANQVNTLYAAAAFARGSGSASRLGERLTPIIRRRAEALLDGTKPDDLPALPSAANVSSEKQRELIAALKAAAPAELDKRLAGLTLDERLVVLERTATDRDLGRVLKDVGNRVVSVRAEVELPKLSGVLAGAKGKPVARETLEAMLDACKEQARGGASVTLSVIRKPCLEGVELAAVAATNAANRGPWSYYARAGAMGKGRKEPFVGGHVSAERLDAQAMWRLQEEAPKTDAAAAKQKEEAKARIAALMEQGDVPPEALEALEEATDWTGGRAFGDDKDFWDKVDRFCAGEGNVGGWGTVAFTSVIPGSEKAEEDDDSDETFDVIE